MNILRRLKKLEQDVAAEGNTDDLCQCYKKHFEAYLNQVYGEPYTASDILPKETPIVDFCDKCNKPVADRIRELYRDVEEIYGKGSLI